jgi:hypothetical protein
MIEREHRHSGYTDFVIPRALLALSAQAAWNP